MKNFLKVILITMICVLAGNVSSQADVTDYIPHKMIVQFEQDFSTVNPPEDFSVIINDNYSFSNLKPIEKGTQLFLTVTKVSKEKKAKMNASVQARIVKAYIPSSETTIIVDNPKASVKFSKYEKIDVADKALNTKYKCCKSFC